jgi:hypothetical protein
MRKISNKRIEDQFKDLKPKDQFTTSKLRAMSREGYELSMTHIVAIAKGDIDDAPHSARIRAHEVLGKSALGDPKNVYIDHKDWFKTIMKVTGGILKDVDLFEKWYAEVRAALKYEV